jgi:hypothetical protein
MTVYSEATPARQGKRPTHRTPRCDKPLGRVKSFRTSQHRRRALTGLAHLTGTQFLKITDRLLDDSTDCIETEGAPRASQNASYADFTHIQP